MILTGGDRETLTSSENVVTNNLIYDWSQVYRTYQAAVNLNGVGTVCSHNEIYNSPHEAITYSGNNHVIEYNVIHDVVLESSDAGAIYAGRSWSYYGNVIRYNCIYNIGSENFTPSGIYFDDALSGQEAYGNLLINIPGCAFLLGGGRDLKIENNLIINAATPIYYDDRAMPVPRRSPKRRPPAGRNTCRRSSIPCCSGKGKTMRYVIGIDLGTSATKTVLFDITGKKIASAAKEYPLLQPQNGWAEQDPADWYAAAIETLRAVVEKSGVSAADIVSLGISGQMHGLVMLDEAGEVLRPAILWCDQRTEKECAEITERVGFDRLIAITANPALTGFTASKILWVKKHEPAIYQKCRHILLPKDYLRYKLTGVFVTEMSDASGMQLLDVPHRCWSKEVLAALDIDPALLGRLYESPEVTGTIGKEAAGLTGLAVGTPVVGGAGDNAAAAVGTGVVRDGRAFTTIGTSGVVYAHTDKPIIDPKGRVHTFCCAVPGAWHVMGVTQAAGLSLQWFKNNFCMPEIERAKQTGKDVYQITDEEASKIPIGADRLLYLPYLMGERTPHLNANCRGVFFGLSAMHTRAHLVRAVMEGVGYSLLDCMQVLKEMNIAPAEMLVTGGGGKSILWRQMICDMFEIPVCTTASSEGPALGVAILAAVGAGIYKSVEAACDVMVQKNDDALLPVRENTAIYRQYHALYKNLYASLKDDFQALAGL